MGDCTVISGENANGEPRFYLSHQTSRTMDAKELLSAFDEVTPIAPTTGADQIAAAKKALASA